MRHVYLSAGSLPGPLTWNRPGVITPNYQAARTLGVAPLTLQDLALRALKKWAVASDFAARRLLRRSARECLALADPDGLARQMAPAVREVLRHGIDLAVLEASGADRARRLAALTRHYRQQLASCGLVDEAELLWRAIEGEVSPAPLFVCGYARLGIDGTAFVDAAAADGSILLLPLVEGQGFFAENRRTVEYLRSKGWAIHTRDEHPVTPGERAARSLRTAQPEPGIGATIHPDIEAEVRHTLGRVGRLLAQKVVPEQIALVVPDLARYGPVVLAVAWEYGVPLKALYPLALDGTRLGAWIALLVQCLRDDFPYATTMALLGHPLVQRLSEAQRRQAKREHPSNRRAWEALGVSLPAWEATHGRTRGEWYAQLHAALDCLGCCAPWCAPQEARVWEHFQAAVQEAGPGDAVLDAATFHDEVLELLAVTTTPIHPEDHGVELHPPVSVLGARFRHLYILGMVEGQLPRAVSDDLFLDFHARRHLGVPLDGADTLAHREVLLFHTALQAATESLTLSCPKQMDGRAVLPSPYFARLGLVPERPEPATPVSAEEYRRYFLRDPAVQADAVLLAARRALLVEERREGSDPCDEYDGVFGLPVPLSSRVFSASQIVEIGQCPFRWFAARLLRLNEPEQAEDDLSASLRGRLYHQVLEAASKAGLSAADQRRAVVDALAGAFDRVERQCNLTALVGWAHRRREHLAVLRGAVQAEDFLGPDARIAAVEAKFEGEWQGLRVSGVVDRIDRTPAGLVLVDYKTGSRAPAGAKNAEGKAAVDVQLPLYVEAAAPVLHPGAPVQDAYYYSLTRARRLKGKKTDTDALQGVVERIRGYFATGRFPVEPDSAGTACSYCPYDALCRRGPRLDAKRGCDATDA
jgi:RecB family exonuclease